MNPYIDKSTNEKGEPEYSIHKLSQSQIQYILSGLDKLASDANMINRTAILSLNQPLTESYDSIK